MKTRIPSDATTRHFGGRPLGLAPFFYLFYNTPMIEQHCYGVIPFKKNQFLLVKHAKGHWAFPKGHPEPGETPQQTAFRELQEETGLQGDLLPLTPLAEHYVYQENGQTIDKTVTYFFATVEGELKLQEAEISEARFVSFEEALELITFEEGRRLCLKAIEAYKHKDAL